ncbi:acid phosphatase [Mollisia scopiformis]|uniref:Acid phosphatase n=1 Tax=Mollisia scopiformis TaxID=149040 RepID=A0A194XLZ0_MOLSC|nr:acid phosphatase [Mollisia scopiformis]KUJ20782.1 acid phosphatase [Mollisia scopiformis]
MLFSTLLVAATLVSVALAVPAPAPASPTATDTTDVYAAQATVLTLSPVSNVKGKAFDRYVSIWLENTDYADAAADPTMEALAKMGIKLTGSYAVTHPSEPNYMAAFAGDYWGVNGDSFLAVPSNVSTVADLLDDKGISWGLYQEGMPYSGYQGPAIVYKSIANTPDKAAKVKNFTMFYEDLKDDKLPQWMFITPNMTNDGHDTNVTFAAKWCKEFLTPLLSDPHFMANTLVHITFDENEDYTIQNQIFTVLLGDAVPADLVGTVDDNYYNHYSELSTVEANWDLKTLGRWDVGANWNNDDYPAFDKMFFNSSYPGIFSSTKWAPQPVPDIHSRRNGRTTLDSIQDTWKGTDDLNYYHGELEIPDGAYPPVYPEAFSAY